MAQEKLWWENPVITQDILKENEELRAENFELRKFVNYVRSLKTKADFMKLRWILQQADKHFNSKSKNDDE